MSSTCRGVICPIRKQQPFQPDETADHDFFSLPKGRLSCTPINLRANLGHSRRLDFEGSDQAAFISTDIFSQTFLASPNISEQLSW